MKKFLAIFLVLVLLTSALSACTSSGSSSSKVTISLAEFNKIENNMTYDQVKEIIGGDGELLSETGQKGADLYVVAYKWDGQGSTGANANFMFKGKDLKLTTKAQYGLK